MTVLEVTVRDHESVTDVHRTTVDDARNIRFILADILRMIADHIKEGQINPTKIEIKELS